MVIRVLGSGKYHLVKPSGACFIAGEADPGLVQEVGLTGFIRQRRCLLEFTCLEQVGVLFI
jgi:hypothetical protein